MPTYQPAKIMRLHFSEHQRYQGKPLYVAIVEKCLEMKIAGATVLRGLEGYGGMAQIHRSHLLKHDLPTVITIVDSAENIDRLTPIVEGNDGDRPHRGFGRANQSNPKKQGCGK